MPVFDRLAVLGFVRGCDCTLVGAVGVWVV